MRLEIVCSASVYQASASIVYRYVIELKGNGELRALISGSILTGFAHADDSSARQDFSRKLKWDPSDFSNEKSRGGYCLRLPGFVLRPLRHTTSRCYAVHHDSRNDLTPCRMVLHFDYASASATTSSKRPTATATRGSSYTAPLTLRFLYYFSVCVVMFHQFFLVYN